MMTNSAIAPRVISSCVAVPVTTRDKVDPRVTDTIQSNLALARDTKAQRTHFARLVSSLFGERRR